MYVSVCVLLYVLSVLYICVWMCVYVFSCVAFLLRCVRVVLSGVLLCCMCCMWLSVVCW